jgi:hypothetical protein
MTMKTWRWVALVLTVGFAGVALHGPAFAQDKKEGIKDKEERERLEALRLIDAAAETAALGREGKAPEALVAAGGMLLRSKWLAGNPEQLKGDVEDKDGTKVKEPAEEVKTLDKQADELFDAALEMAQDTAQANALKAVIDATKKRYAKTRAAVGGLKQAVRTIGAGRQHTHTVQMFSGMPAAVAFQSNHSVRFEVFEPGIGKVFDLVGTNGRYSWTPRGRGTKPIKIMIHGLGSGATYRLVAN